MPLNDDVKYVYWVWDRYINVVTWTNCNANCNFCFERDLPRINEDISIIKKTLLDWINQWIYDVSFSWWEITIYEEVIDLLRFAKEIGYKNISLTTNWLKLANKDFANSLLQYIDNIEISIHSIDYNIWDKIMWVPGGLKRTLDALNNVMHYINSNNSRITITIMTVLVNENTLSILKTIEYFNKMGIKKLVLLYWIWGATTFSIESIAKIVEFITNKYKWKIDVRFSYIQPCVFSDKFLSEWNWNKWFFLANEEKLVSNDRAWILAMNKTLVLDKLITTSKCKSCEFYKKICFWFWKNIYDKAWYDFVLKKNN